MENNLWWKMTSKRKTTLKMKMTAKMKMTEKMKITAKRKTTSKMKTRIEFLVWHFQLLNRHLDNWCKDKCHSDNRSLIFILFVVSVPNFIPIVYIFLEDFGVGCSYSCFSSSWSSSSSRSLNRGKTKSTSSLKTLTEVWQYTLHGPKICWDLALFWIYFLW